MAGLTKAEAIALGESGFWETMSYRDRALFQLLEERLCMPWDVFHEAVQKALDRPVFTHEFANREGLVRQLMGEEPMPSFEDVLNLIPVEKRIVLTPASAKEVIANLNNLKDEDTETHH